MEDEWRVTGSSSLEHMAPMPLSIKQRLALLTTFAFLAGSPRLPP